MELTPAGKIIKGYKATDNNMRCRGFQFELGKWFTHDDDVSLCASGFHFCEYPSGPWAYYSEGRLFEVEAQMVSLSNGPGADLKHVCKKIKLINEIQNTGHENTGDRNTGDRNTGHGNTGDRNTGDYHSGFLNSGKSKFYIFNKLAKRKDVDFRLIGELGALLLSDEDIDPTPFLSLPNSTANKTKKLHDEHKRLRNARSRAMVGG